MSTVKDFSGGLNTRPHPQLINQNNSIIYDNCENEEGILKPTKGYKESKFDAKKRWVHFKYCDTIVSSDREMWWAELDDRLYEDDGTKIEKVDCQGNRTALGIEKPQNILSLTDAGPGELCGTYKYVYTYWNSTEGIESQPNQLSNALDTHIKPPVVVPPIDPNAEERKEFVMLGAQFDLIHENYVLLDKDYKSAVVAMECALTHAGPFTLTRFKDYVAQQLVIFNTAGDVALKEQKMMCKKDSYPESFAMDKSYSSMLLRVRFILDQIAAGGQGASTRAKLGVECVIKGEPDGAEVNGPEYHELINELITASKETPPAMSPVKGDKWYILQYECIISNMPTVTEPDVDLTDKKRCRKILVSGIKASTDPQVTHIRLYRIGGGLTNYNLVVELPNTDQTYLDNNKDDDIAGNHVLDSFTNGLPPKDPKYLTEGNAMLFVASKTKLYFSDVAKPYAWPESNFLDFSVDITGMGMVQNGLLVFTRYRTYIVTGTNPSTMARFLISDSQGCINHDTIAFGDNLLIWVSTDGVCTSNGGFVEVVTQQLLGRFNPEDTINGWVWDKMYFLGYKGATLILDSRYGYCVRKLDYSGWYGSFKDELYMQKSGKLQKMFVGGVDTMHYKSPIYTEGRLSEYKMFKDIYVTFKGDIHMKILIHGHQAPYQWVVYDYKLKASEMQKDIKTLGTIMGYGISFEITGKGEVHEIEFKASGRENGK